MESRPKKVHLEKILYLDGEPDEMNHKEAEQEAGTSNCQTLYAIHKETTRAESILGFC